MCLTKGSLPCASPCAASARARARPGAGPRHPHRQDISLPHTQLAWPLSFSLHMSGSLGPARCAHKYATL